MPEPGQLDEAFHFIMGRMDPDWVSRSGEYAMQMVATMAEIGKTGPFWRPIKP